MANKDKKILSCVDLRERIKNENAYRTATNTYYPVFFINAEGEEVPGLFTISDIKKAAERAENNPEDVGTHVKTTPSIWHSIFG